MPRLIGVRERLGHTLYSGWIADTRPGGMGVSHHASFSDPMRLYVSDIGDKLRTNLHVPGRLLGEQTAKVLQIGFHVSFDVEARYNEFFNEPTESSFVLNVNGEDVHTLRAADSRSFPKPTYDYGIRMQHDMLIPVTIEPQIAFNVTLNTGKEFANTMRYIDTGKWTAYTEVKHFMNVLMTREVQ